MENNLADTGDEPGRPDAAEARDALMQLQDDGSRLAQRVVTPWWYYPVLGAIVALFTLAPAFPIPLGIWMIAIGIVALPILTLTYRRLYGVSTTEPAGPRTRRLLFLTVAASLLPFVISVALRVIELAQWWALIPTAFAFLATIVLGRLYDNALRDELAAKPDHVG